MSIVNKHGYVTPVHAWAPPANQLHPGLPVMQNSPVPTFKEWAAGLPDNEPHHVIIYDSKAG